MMKLSALSSSLLLLSTLVPSITAYSSNEADGVDNSVPPPGVDPVGGTPGGVVADPLVADETLPVTFNEFPYGTVISDQYVSAKGVYFFSTTNSAPYTVDDFASTSTPVLSGDPIFSGIIAGVFMDTSMNLRPVASFSMDVGYLNKAGAVTLVWYDENGNELGSYSNTVVDGTEKMSGSGGNISYFTIDNLNDSSDLYGIDNFVSAPPVVVPPVGPKVTQLVLIDSAADVDIAVLEDGMTFNAADIGTRLNIRADVTSSVNSVKFWLNGVRVKVESFAPFAMAGNMEDDYRDDANLASPGVYTVEARAFTEVKAEGEKSGKFSVTFTIV